MDIFSLLPKIQSFDDLCSIESRERYFICGISSKDRFSQMHEHLRAVGLYKFMFDQFFFQENDYVFYLCSFMDISYLENEESLQDELNNIQSTMLGEYGFKPLEVFVQERTQISNKRLRYVVSGDLEDIS